MNPAVAILTTLVRAYRTLISPMFPPSCRFVPTCSQYALDAINTHGAIKGTWLAMRRISRCHPLHPGGFDPVPGMEPQSPHDHDS